MSVITCVEFVKEIDDINLDNDNWKLDSYDGYENSLVGVVIDNILVGLFLDIESAEKYCSEKELENDAMVVFDMNESDPRLLKLLKMYYKIKNGGEGDA